MQTFWNLEFRTSI